MKGVRAGRECFTRKIPLFLRGMMSPGA
jgi:hypothetical protein